MSFSSTVPAHTVNTSAKAFIGAVYRGGANMTDLRDAIRSALGDLPIETSAMEAVIQVESAGRGFERDGSPRRRFEPHHMPSALRRRLTGRDAFSWRDSERLSTRQREAMYGDALAIDAEAAHHATSYGVGQIMGFNAKLIGYRSATAMFEAFASLEAQIAGMIAFMRRKPGVLDAIAARDWLEVGRLYNGSGQPAVYAAKVEAAYRKITGHASPVVLRSGDRGAAVTELQAALARAGFPCPDDGAFGPVTDAAVQSFQRARGLPADGLVGARTWARLHDIGASPVHPPAQPAATPRADIAATAGKVAAGAGAVTAAVKGLSEATEATAGLFAGIDPTWLLAALAVGGALFGAAMIARRRGRAS